MSGIKAAKKLGLSLFFAERAASISMGTKFKVLVVRLRS